MKVLFFAQSREAAGRDECHLQIEKPVTESEFWTALINQFPPMAALRKTARLARRETYLQSGEMLDPGDEIAIIPPVSGG